MRHTYNNRVRMMLEIFKTITSHKDIVYGTLQALMLITIVYWLYYRRYILNNPDKSNDQWF